MPYDRETEDRAMANLMADMGRLPDHPTDPPRRTFGGVAFGLFLLALLFGLAALLAGCGTLAGIQQDVHRLTAPVDQPPAPVYHTDR